MKKISLFFALFLVLGLGKSFAGYLNIINMTPCSFQFYSGIGSITNSSGTFQFTFGPGNIPPGTTSYPNVTMLPGFSPAGLSGTGCAEITKVNGPGGAAFPIGKMAPYTAYTSSNNPACYGGSNYTMTWNTGSNNCDAEILNI